MMAPDCPSDGHESPSRRLSLLDATSILVGIVIGAGLYETAPMVARNVPGPAWMAGVWIAGGVIALLGAATYAELTTTYTEPGGEFAFLSRAYGNRLGFVFAWSQLWVVRPGSIGAMAFIFGNYWRQLFPWGGHARVEMLYALAAIVLLSIVCGMGIRPGVWTQNVLTGAKVVGLLLIVLVAFLAPAVPTDHRQLAGSVGETGDLRLALILVLFTYGGWNDMAYVAAEVRRPRKNLVRALFLGTLAVTVVYVAINGAFVHVLGMEGVRHSRAVAADTVRVGLGQGADRAISLLICLSCLGAIHGMLLTGSRIYYAMGTRYPFFATLGTWNQRRGSPTTSLVLQTGITVAVVLGFGLYENSFQRMVVFTTPIFWFFFLLTGLSLFVLRWKVRGDDAPQTSGPSSQDGPQTGVSAIKKPSEAAPRTDASCSHNMPQSQDGSAGEKPNRSRGFRVIGYPWTPGLFCLACLLMLVESLDYAFEHRAGEAVWSTLLLAIGCLLSLTAAGRSGGKTARAGLLDGADGVDTPQ